MMLFQKKCLILHALFAHYYNKTPYTNMSIPQLGVGTWTLRDETGAQPITNYELRIAHYIASTLAPELRRKDDENGKYLKTSHKHEQRAYPFGKVRKVVP